MVLKNPTKAVGTKAHISADFNNKYVNCGLHFFDVALSLLTLRRWNDKIKVNKHKGDTYGKQKL